MGTYFAGPWESKKAIATILADDVKQSAPAKAKAIEALLSEFTSLPTPKNVDEFLGRSRAFMMLQFKQDTIAAEEHRSTHKSL